MERGDGTGRQHEYTSNTVVTNMQQPTIKVEKDLKDIDFAVYKQYMQRRSHTTPIIV